MENIHVSLRLRPLNEKEIKQSEKAAWEVIDQHTIQVVNDNIVNQTSRNVIQNALQYNKQPSFNYDRCFDETVNNKSVYENCVQSILKSSLNGVNGTIFMYGQSGSGKTYTMMGYEKKTNQQQTYSSGVSSNNQLSIFNYQSQPSSNQQRKRTSSQNAHSLSPISKTNNGSGNNFQEIDDIDFEKIKSNTPDDNKGILMLALQDFFDTIKKDEDKTYVVRCSYVEIYNDQIYDLLNPVNKLNEVLQVGLNQNKEFYIKGVTQESVSNLEEAYEVLKTGETNKHYAQTTMNHHSSRSHSIFKLYVQSISSVLLKSCMPRKSTNNPAQRNVNNQELLAKLNEHDSTLISTSELNFIDLAGSEKVSNHSNLEEILLNSGSKNQSSSNTRDYSPQDLIKDRVKEGQFINKSLFFLTQVISQIAEGKPLTHIPYRNSPLTKILKSSLGGNSRTMIILCITPAQSQFEQSYSTIRFGLNAKKIENKVRVNIQAKNNEEALQLLILDYEKKIRDLEQQRNEEKTRNGDLIKKLNELSYQNSQIQQRLMNSNRKNIELSLTRTSNFEGVCQNCQKSNQNSSIKGDKERVNQKRENSIKKQKWISEKQQELVNEQTVHCDYVGVLFPTRNNITVGDVNPQVKRNWQDLIFDYEGRYAFHQYQMRNKQFAAYLQMWDKVNTNIERVTEHHLRVYDCAQKMKNSLKNYEGSLDSVVQKLNSKLQNNSFQQQYSQQFMIDLGSITLEEIKNIEKTLQKSLEQVIQEKYKRNIFQSLDLKQNLLNQNEKNKFINIINNGSASTMNYNNFMIIDLPDSEKNKRIIDQSNKNNNKGKTVEEDQLHQQLDTSIDDIKRYLKENEGPKASQQFIQNSLEQERDLIKQLFYRSIDPQILAGANQLDLNEADFKHLKCIINKSTYSHLNIFTQPSVGDNESHEFNKKIGYLTPKVNKFSTNNKSKLNEGDDENEKKDQQSFEDDQNNIKRNKPSIGYFTQSHQQNNFLFNNTSNLEERLQYHQKPIPKEQEEEIQQNFEKLQNQSYFFDGCSTISNINSNYTPSNASFNQNVNGSQKFMNNLTNQLQFNGTLNVLNSNAPSIASNGNLVNFNTTHNNTNQQNQGPINIQQLPAIQNFLSNQAFTKQAKSSEGGAGYQPQNQYLSVPTNNLVNQQDGYISSTVTNNINKIIYNHDDEIDKNPLNSIKQNTNSVPDSVNSLTNINLLESTKQNHEPDGTQYAQNYLPSSQISINTQLHHNRSQSVHEASSSNSQSKQNSSSKANNVGYYLGPVTNIQQINRTDTLMNKTDQNQINYNNYGGYINENNNLFAKGIPKNQNYSLNLPDNGFSATKQLGIEGKTRNFEKQDPDKNNNDQSFEQLLKKQENALSKQADLLIQQYSGHRRHQSSSNTSNVVINLAQPNYNSIQPTLNSNYTAKKIMGAESLQKDESSESLSHRRSGSVQQAKSYQKIIGNISKGSSTQLNNSQLKDNSLLNNSLLQQNQSKSQLNQSSSKQNINSNNLQSIQNYQSANVTPKKQAIKLNNTISIDIIQLQSNQPFSAKPLGVSNKQPQQNQISQNSSLIYDNQQSSNRKQSNSLHTTVTTVNDKTYKIQNYQNQPSYNNNSLNGSSSNINNYMSSNSTYSGYSHLNKNLINYDENHIQQMIQKSSSQQNYINNNN